MKGDMCAIQGLLFLSDGAVCLGLKEIYSVIILLCFPSLLLPLSEKIELDDRKAPKGKACILKISPIRSSHTLAVC